MIKLKKKFYKVIVHGIYHLDFIKSEELKVIQDFINLEGKGRILDIACGPGYHGIKIAKEGWNVYGVDMRESYTNC